jgi:hypothetical protein
MRGRVGRTGPAIRARKRLWQALDTTRTSRTGVRSVTRFARTGHEGGHEGCQPAAGAGARGQNDHVGEGLANRCEGALGEEDAPAEDRQVVLRALEWGADGEARRAADVASRLGRSPGTLSPRTGRARGRFRPRRGPGGARGPRVRPGGETPVPPRGGRSVNAEPPRGARRGREFSSPAGMAASEAPLRPRRPPARRAPRWQR